MNRVCEVKILENKKEEEGKNVFDKREILVNDWYFFLLKKKRNLYNPYEKGVNNHPYLSISFILFLFF